MEEMDRGQCMADRAGFSRPPLAVGLILLGIVTRNIIKRFVFTHSSEYILLSCKPWT